MRDSEIKFEEQCRPKKIQGKKERQGAKTETRGAVPAPEGAFHSMPLLFQSASHLARPGEASPASRTRTVPPALGALQSYIRPRSKQMLQFS